MEQWLKPGDMILLRDGGVAFLVEQFCPFEEQMRREDPECDVTSWPTAWRITFADPSRLKWRDYDDKYGWSSMNIENNVYGKLIRT